MALKHKQSSCFNPDTCGGTCYCCTIAVCSVCGGLEGSLTTHCCGEQLSMEQLDEIYKNGLDFVDGEWIYLEDKYPMNKHPVFEE